MIPEINGDLLQWLRGFYYVATCGSVSAAAEQVHCTQSAVTYQIRALERELGLSLFSRLKNKMVLTDDGARLLEWALRIFDGVSGMQEDLRGKNRNGVCRIAGSRPTFLSEPFSQCLDDFHGQWPHIHIALHSSFPDLLYDSVTHGQSDFGLVGTSSTIEHLDFKELFQSPCLLVMNRDFPFDGHTVTRESLKKMPYISFSLDSRGRSAKEAFLPKEAQKSLHSNTYISCSNYYIIMKYVAKGVGYTIMDAWSLKTFAHMLDQLKVFSLEHLFPPLRYGIIRRRKAMLSAAPQCFADLITDRLSRVDLFSDIQRLCRRSGGTNRQEAARSGRC